MEFFENFFSQDGTYKKKHSICASCKQSLIDTSKPLCIDCCNKSIYILVSLIKNDELNMDFSYIERNIPCEIWLEPVYDQVKDVENSAAYYFIGVYLYSEWGKTVNMLKGLKYLNKSSILGNNCATDELKRIKSEDMDDIGKKIFDRLLHLETKNQKLKYKNKMLELENAEFKYQPGGVGYEEAKEDFERRKNE